MKNGQFRGFLFLHFRTAAQSPAHGIGGLACHGIGPGAGLDLMQRAMAMPAPLINGQPTIVGKSEAAPPRLVIEQLQRMRERRSGWAE